MFKRILAAAALLAAFSPAMAHADLLVNGDFSQSDPSAIPGSTFTTLYGGSTALTGWSVGGNSIDYIGGYWQAPAGAAFSVDLSGNGPGSISQTFATTAGDTYKVTFSLAGNPNGDPVVKSGYAVIDTGLTQIAFNPLSFDVTSTTQANMGWTTETFTFVANAAQETLSFFDTDLNSPFGLALGNVSVLDLSPPSAPTPAPEPGTLSLLAAGLIGSYCMRRRQKNT